MPTAVRFWTFGKGIACAMRGGVWLPLRDSPSSLRLKDGAMARVFLEPGRRVCASRSGPDQQVPPANWFGFAFRL